MNDAADRLRLARSEGVGPITYRRLLARFGTAKAAIDGLPELARAAGRRTPMRIPPRSAAEREMAEAERLGARLLFFGTPDYPPLLATIADPPPVLAVLGDPALTRSRSVAIVGSRNASANGRRLAETLAADLAAAGLTVVSGLARGIDAAAHRGALERGGTVACIAGGIDTVYPPENAALQAHIARDGAVVAEMPPGTIAQARHFPRRNRVIAGLALGIVVVEAAARSGSLITARLALEANRDVFAVPGSPLDERCRGTNGLLRQGAHLTETAEDVLAQLGGLAQAPLFGPEPGFAEAAETVQMSPAERSRAQSELRALLGPAPTMVDDLIRRCQLPASAVMSILLDLEIAGDVESLPGNRWALISDPS
jgi:DNA processing protein